MKDQISSISSKEPKPIPKLSRTSQTLGNSKLLIRIIPRILRKKVNFASYNHRKLITKKTRTSLPRTRNLRSHQSACKISATYHPSSCLSQRRTLRMGSSPSSKCSSASPSCSSMSTHCSRRQAAVQTGRSPLYSRLASSMPALSDKRHWHCRRLRHNPYRRPYSKKRLSREKRPP